MCLYTCRLRQGQRLFGRRLQVEGQEGEGVGCLRRNVSNPRMERQAFAQICTAPDRFETRSRAPASDQSTAVSDVRSSCVQDAFEAIDVVTGASRCRESWP